MKLKKLKSIFGTVIIILLIALSGFFLVHTIIDSTMDVDISGFLPNPCNKVSDKQIPVFVCFIISHLDLTVYIDLMMYAGIFISSIGLLARKKWSKNIFWLSLIIGSGLKFVIFLLLDYYLH